MVSNTNVPVPSLLLIVFITNKIHWAFLSFGVYEFGWYYSHLALFLGIHGDCAILTRALSTNSVRFVRIFKCYNSWDM